MSRILRFIELIISAERLNWTLYAIWTDEDSSAFMLFSSQCHQIRTAKQKICGLPFVCRSAHGDGDGGVIIISKHIRFLVFSSCKKLGLL